LKGVPKSHVYRIIRSGEVRVNSRRAEVSQRLAVGESVRVPPLRTAQSAALPKVAPHRGTELLMRAIFEDRDLLVIDKPPGVAVHGGSGVSLGAIEALRAARPELKFLELAHRLDRDTSGVLVLAKRRAALLKVHEALREGEADKRYLVLVAGQWRQDKRTVRLALAKLVTPSGERRVKVEAEGAPSETVFYRKEAFDDFTLLEAQLKTGRTHQIRVHLAHLGFPIAGDDKYGDFALNKDLARRGLKRLFLHAHTMRIAHPASGEPLALEATLAEDLQRFLSRLRDASAVKESS
jgi:23S rRNA pseudouridine955/2504/2580 synthase